MQKSYKILWGYCIILQKFAKILHVFPPKNSLNVHKGTI